MPHPVQRIAIWFSCVLSGLAVVAVQLKYSHTWTNASDHIDRGDTNRAGGKNSEALFRPAHASVSTKPSSRSSTPMN